MLPSSDEIAAVIVAAGKGVRAGQDVPKQFASYKTSTVLREALICLQNAGVSNFAVVIPEGSRELAESCLRGIDNLLLVCGGATRQESVAKGLDALADFAPAIVLIHDAARPDCPADVVSRLVSALQEYPGAIPVLPVVDSMIVAEGGLMAGDARREVLRRVQTPQAFRFEEILAAHRAWDSKLSAGDDAQVLKAHGGEVAIVDGDERLKKLTYAEDFMSSQSPSLPVRVGSGYDVHRLVDGETLWLCGVRLDYKKGLAGHSDADVGLHALVDAILGAISAGDIGQHFPPSDPQWKGAPSSRFVEHAVHLAGKAGYTVGNVDLTLVCEAPKIGPHREAMRARLGELLAIDECFISVKATTTERLGFTGRGEGIAAQAVVTMVAK